MILSMLELVLLLMLVLMLMYMLMLMHMLMLMLVLMLKPHSPLDFHVLDCMGSTHLLCLATS